jgi:hypothetical protein
MNKSFYNFATQSEKAEQLKLERQRREEPPEPTTLHQLAKLGDTSLGGRFSLRHEGACRVSPTA